MPLIFKENFKEDCLLGIWEIQESYDDLISQVQLYTGEKERLAGFRSKARKVEFLSVRILLKALIGICGPIVYNDLQKPFLHQSEYRLSITHSRTLTAIILSKTKKVGIDLEFMSHKISKVAHKFINEDEYINPDEDKRKYHLYIHWCAKEALYKLCDKQDINFKENLTIERFEPVGFGVINGWVENNFWHDKFELSYFSINNYIVVYTCKNT